MTVVACLKWVDARPTVDPLTGDVQTDPRSSGASDADWAALEWALRIGDEWGSDVIALTAGGGLSEPLLREALAAGATTACRVDTPDGAPSDQVAAALASAVTTTAPTAEVVVCGNWSSDRGSGSVPAFLAARLGAAQALGLVTLTITAGAGRELRAQRRLDGGRREVLSIPTPAVISVEGGSARLRRASLPAVVRAETATIDVIPAPSTTGSVAPVRIGPFRPRARVSPAPSSTLSARERILALTGALVDRQPPQTLALEPPAAAAKIIDQLRDWGYLT